jgi:hypothetical protein
MTPTQLCTAMLPILRILPVGGVLLAILILVLALSPPDGSRAPLSPTIVPARGALVDRDHRPEVRQFMIHAALKRANELNRLRELPDTPTRSEDTQPQLAGIPTDRIDTDLQEAGSINETPAINVPTEVSEPLPIELPAPPPHDLAPAVKKPEQAKPQRDARRRAYRPRNGKSTATAQPHQFNLFEIFFGQQSASIIQQAGSAISISGLQLSAVGFPSIPIPGVLQPAGRLSVPATGIQSAGQLSVPATGLYQSADRPAATSPDPAGEPVD